MPLYTCIVGRDADLTSREKLSAALTRVHCETTGAPPEFVHVAFFPALPRFTRDAVRIVGSVRRGRPPELRAQLVDELRDAAAEALNAEASRVHVELIEADARWVMEGGTVLPPPGSEGDWMKTHWKE